MFGGKLGYTVSGASALDPRLAHFFRGAGIQVLEGYGLTESTAPCTANTVDHTRVGSVGIPMPGTTIRIDDDGEVLVRGCGVFAGYHHRPEANAEAFTADGYFRTGDLGSLDEDGFLTLTGRKKDLIVTSGGKNVAPGPLEDLLRGHRLIAHAVLVGDSRPFVAALLALDAEAVASWGAAHGKSGLTASSATGDPLVLAELQAAVDHANATVSRAEQIRKFAAIGTEFSLESGHLTPTLKLKRSVVVAEHEVLIEDLYTSGS